MTPHPPQWFLDRPTVLEDLRDGLRRGVPAQTIYNWLCDEEGYDGSLLTVTRICVWARTGDWNYAEERRNRFLPITPETRREAINELHKMIGLYEPSGHFRRIDAIRVCLQLLGED